MNNRLTFLTCVVLFALLASLPVYAQETAAPFPVTIEHKFGTTTITEAPQRVVAIGFTEQDPLLALGIKPVAVRYWYGDTTNAIFPWAQDEAEGAQPVVLNMPFGSLNYEAILALQPDLISAVDSGITQEEYEALSQIAPTLAQSGQYIDFGMPWQETTRMIGAAVGKSAEAEALIAQVEARFEEARAQNPEFAGKSIAVAYHYDGNYGYYTDQDSRGRFFSNLGFEVPHELIDIAGESFYANVSAERIDLLDRDLIVFLGLAFVEGGRQTIEADPLIKQLDAVREGRVVYVPAELDDALQFSTVLSLEFVLEGLLPELKAAVNSGMAGQSPAECEAGFRVFDHDLLVGDPVCIPEDPQRVTYLLYPSYIYPFGIKPVGSWGLERDAANYPLIADWILTDIIDHGMPPNLETLTALAPDLLLYDASRVTDVVDELPLIAPLVMYDDSGLAGWRDRHLFNGAVFDQLELAQQQLDVYDTRAGELREALRVAHGDVNDITVSVVRLRGDQGISLLGPYYTSVNVLADVGFSLPEAVSMTAEEMQAAYGNAYNVEISQEQIPLANADLIFLIGSVGGAQDQSIAGEELVAELMTDPLWNTLTAFQNDRVYAKRDYWLQSNLLTAHSVLDELAKLFEVEIPTPNPFLTDLAEATPEAGG